MNGYLLDTNHLSAAIDADSLVYAKILASRREGYRIGTCAPVLCELAVGIEQTRHRTSNWKILQIFLRQVRIWPIEISVIQRYGELYHELRARGRVLSQVDMMVAALARTMDLTILTTDRDFEALPDIKAENWAQ